MAQRPPFYSLLQGLDGGSGVEETTKGVATQGWSAMFVLVRTAVVLDGAADRPPGYLGVAVLLTPYLGSLLC